MTRLEDQYRNERRRLKASDQVAIINRYGRVEVKQVTLHFRVSVLVGKVEYWVESGCPINQRRASRLRGLATFEDIEAVNRRVGTGK
jgi:hypothetical protein